MSGQGARRTTRNPSSPGQLPTADDVADLLELTDFRDFSNQVQDAHDQIHGWTGGDMGSIGTSAFDPVFWGHHAMIDRLWYLWQLEHGVNNIPADYLDMALFPGYTVGQVLDVRSLGYDYATAAVAEGTDVPEGVGGSDTTTAPPPDAGGEPTPAPKPPTTGPTYTSKPLSVGALDPAAKRIDIELHDVDHAGASYEGRVYLNKPDADDTTGTADPSYAGSYHVFGHGGCLGDPGHCDVKERRPYDPRPAHQLSKATKVVTTSKEGRAAIQGADKVRVTVVPIIEPLPYKNVDAKHVEDPLDIGYVRIVGYR